MPRVEVTQPGEEVRFHRSPRRMVFTATGKYETRDGTTRSENVRVEVVRFIPGARARGIAAAEKKLNSLGTRLNHH